MKDRLRSRARYRPERITTLFVGESPPASGKFFYRGNTALARSMEAAMAAAGLRDGSDFHDRFKSCGWYLDDALLNHLTRSQRTAACLRARSSLADRIAGYRPLAIVTVLLRIKDIVDNAAIAAGSDAPRFAVAFPGNGQQARFLKEMADIVPTLPRASLIKQDSLTKY
jgi:hypothetical protein